MSSQITQDGASGDNIELRQRELSEMKDKLLVKFQDILASVYSSEEGGLQNEEIEKELGELSHILETPMSEIEESMNSRRSSRQSGRENVLQDQRLLQSQKPKVKYEQEELGDISNNGSLGYQERYIQGSQRSPSIQKNYFLNDLNLEELHSEIKEQKRIKNVEISREIKQNSNSRMKRSGLEGGSFRDSKEKKKNKDVQGQQNIQSPERMSSLELVKSYKLLEGLRNNYSYNEYETRDDYSQKTFQGLSVEELSKQMISFQIQLKERDVQILDKSLQLKRIQNCQQKLLNEIKQIENNTELKLAEMRENREKLEQNTEELLRKQLSTLDLMNERMIDTMDQVGLDDDNDNYNDDRDNHRISQDCTNAVREQQIQAIRANNLNRNVSHQARMRELQKKINQLTEEKETLQRHQAQMIAEAQQANQKATKKLEMNRILEQLEKEKSNLQLALDELTLKCWRRRQECAKIEETSSEELRCYEESCQIDEETRGEEILQKLIDNKDGIISEWVSVFCQIDGNGNSSGYKDGVIGGNAENVSSKIKGIISKIKEKYGVFIEAVRTSEKTQIKQDSGSDFLESNDNQTVSEINIQKDLLSQSLNQIQADILSQTSANQELSIKHQNRQLELEQLKAKTQKELTDYLNSCQVEEQQLDEEIKELQISIHDKQQTEKNQNVLLQGQLKEELHRSLEMINYLDEQQQTLIKQRNTLKVQSEKKK